MNSRTNIQVSNCNNQNNQLFKLNLYNKDIYYTGIDISSYQKNINWENLIESKIGFIMIRAGFGDNWTSQDDKSFKDNVANCEKYNIPYGIYLYSYAKNLDGSTKLNDNSESITSEAEHMLRLLREIDQSGYKPNIKTPIYIDIEDDSTKSLGKNTLTKMADKFCNIINSNGFNCGIYANRTWLTTYLDASYLSNKYDIWLAEWSDKLKHHDDAKNSKPQYDLSSYKLWQFSSSGTISGIDGYLDLNIGYNIFE